MTGIDFTEIPCANIGSGVQDTFELFARDFISEILGFKIISQPNRGADEGKDILVEEIQYGTLSESRVRWLVSCKHLAHSGKSVSESDEQNISDRVRQHKADGFLGFYSTIPSSGLGKRLEAFESDFKVRVFDGRKIESCLLDSRNEVLLKRYFPKSFAAWIQEPITPALLLSEYEPLPCKICGKDLLEHKKDGLVLFVRDMEKYEIEDVVCVCRGECDRKYDASLRSRGYISGWEGIDDFSIPTIFLKRQMALINNLFYKKALMSFSENAIEAYKDVLIAISQLVMRNRTDEEWERVLSLEQIPEGL